MLLAAPSAQAVSVESDGATPPLARRRFGSAAAVVMTLLASAVLAPSTAFAAGRDSAGSRPPRAYFGMHYAPVGDGVSWPHAPVGLMRLWDTRTSWRDIQPARHSWNFAVLDAAVANARKHGADISLVLGQSPTWASSRPAEHGAFYGVGAAAPPARIADWRHYVHAVAARYRGRIASYEIWNEVNLPGYYTGTVDQMVRLTRIGRQAITRADPQALVLGPSVTLRTGTSYLRAFAAAGGYRYADVVDIHGYPAPELGPEGGAAMVARARTEVSAYPGGDKPVWNTELNYGLQRPAGGGIPVRLSTPRQAAYIARAYLLNWSHGVQRLVWYDWSQAAFQGVRLSAGGPTAAPPGQAYRTVRAWMRGRISPCTVGRHGVYRCTIRYSDHRWGSVRWVPSGTRVTVAPAGTFARHDLLNNATPTRSQARVSIGFSPVLFTYRR
jgi:hypothetical protein